MYVPMDAAWTRHERGNIEEWKCHVCEFVSMKNAWAGSQRTDVILESQRLWMGPLFSVVI